MTRRLAILAALIFSWCGEFASLAQEPAKAASAKPIDTAYITDDYFAAVVIHPARIAAASSFKGPARAQVNALLKPYGLEAQQVEQIVLLLPAPQRVDRGPDHWEERAGGPHGVVRLVKPEADAKLLARIVKAMEAGELQEVDTGRIYWKVEQGSDLAFDIADERTIFVGDERAVRARLISRVGRGPLAELVKQADASADVLALIDPAAIRRILPRGRDLTPLTVFEVLPAEMTSQVLRRIDSLTLTGRLSTGAVALAVQSTSPEDAELVHDLLRGVLAGGKLLAESSQRISQAERRALSLDQAIDLFRTMLAGAKTARSGNQVTLHVDLKERTPQMIATISQEVARMNQQARVARSQSNLRELALAMHNYHDTFNYLPSHASFAKPKEGDDGVKGDGVKGDGVKRKDKAKPLLSWRVYVLPYLEQSTLHREFRFDEPWDSPHNKKLIAKMPSVFKSPQKELGEGKTCYVLPVGDDKKYPTMFPPGPNGRNWGTMADGAPGVFAGLSFGQITDGLSNTLMIVEAPPEKAVTWTKPDDWEVNYKDPKKGLFGMWKGFALAAMGDGSVHRISESVSDETLRRALGRHDGEILDGDDLSRGVPSGGAGIKLPAASEKRLEKVREKKSAASPDFEELPKTRVEPPKR